MIYTVTLNPSIDYSVRLKDFRAGMTNRTIDENCCIGGKGINVSLVLSELDIESTALGFTAGFTGEQIEKYLLSENIHSDFIRLRNGMSRINVKIRTDSDESEINAQGPEIQKDEFELLLQKTDKLKDGDTLVLAGSIPSSLPDNMYEVIIERLKDRDICIVVDSSKDLLIKTLPYRPFLIKPNKQELEEIFSAEIKDETDIEKYAKRLMDIGARNVLVSLGSDGAELFCENGKTYRSGTLKEKVIGTVGAGDSMIAGFLAGYQKTGNYETALKFGTACGNATAFSNGLAKKEKIYEVMKKLPHSD